MVAGVPNSDYKSVNSFKMSRATEESQFDHPTKPSNESTPTVLLALEIYFDLHLPQSTGAILILHREN